MIGKIIGKKIIAQGTLLVKVDLEGQELSFKPGQYTTIILPNMPYPEPRNGRRHFSILSSPDEKRTIEFATRLREESAYKKYLQELPLGTSVEIGSISGSFTLPNDQSVNYVFIAGGIGITPFISMLRYKIANLLQHKITLLYSNRDVSSTAFLAELKEMTQKDSNIKLVVTVTNDPGWEGEKRMIDSNFIKEYFSEPNGYHYYVAGPPAMVEAVDKALMVAGVDQAYITKENFAGY